MEAKAIQYPALLPLLPKVFHPGEKGENQPPLDTLLHVIEQNFAKIHEQLDRFERNVDWAQAPQLPPHDFLSWLGNWVGITLWPEWSEAKKRFVISQAAMLYRYRGTRLGLEYLITLFLDLDVTIREWEWPKGFIVGSTSTVGLDSHLMNRRAIQQCFVVYWNVSEKTVEPKVVKRLHHLIQQEKPAHTAHYVQVHQPGKGPSKHLKKLIIGQSSIIGAFFIEGED
ncbi:MAG: hypothetical protein KC587_13545 [Nitrospira sp.]|nr:hypothetical protein [Nitrospira sp.]MCA9457684.1 hypothetical protein [Nitrospira sp.]MCW5783296.1 hypothetical protein [Nitrospirales bacterium]